MDRHPPVGGLEGSIWVHFGVKCVIQRGKVKNPDGTEQSWGSNPASGDTRSVIEHLLNTVSGLDNRRQWNLSSKWGH